jgi:Ribbon-helix-helix domain
MKAYIPEHVSVSTSALGPIINASQVAALLDCPTEHVERLAETGHLPGRKYGSGWIFVTAQLLRHIAAECANNLPAPTCVGPTVARVGQSPNTKFRFTVYLDPALAAALRSLCECTGRSLCKLLREAVCLLLAKYKETRHGVSP